MGDMLMDIDSLGEEDADVSISEDGDQMELYTYKDHTLDCYPYTFSPLLLFSTDGYFDRGYSNYNAVASFFDPVLRGVLGDFALEDDSKGCPIKTSPGKSSSSHGESPQNKKDESSWNINMLEGVIYERKNMT